MSKTFAGWKITVDGVESENEVVSGQIKGKLLITYTLVEDLGEPLLRVSEDGTIEVLNSSLDYREKGRVKMYRYVPIAGREIFIRFTRV